MNTTEQIMALVLRLRARHARIYLGPERLVEAADAIESLVQERDAAQEAERAQADMRTQDTVLIDNLTRERDDLKTRLHEVSLNWQSVVHERDALSAGWEQERNVSDKWNLECDELREDNKRLAAENKALRDGIRVYQTQLEKDTSESDLDTLVRQGAEVAELKVENKTLRDALSDAATSLETVSTLAGRETYGLTPIPSYMGTFQQVRGYAASRCRVARAAAGANHEPN